MATQRLQIKAPDGITLEGRIERPKGPARATAVFAHCFTCGKDIVAAKRVSAGLAAQGIAVLRFDFTGLGQSGGAFEETTLASNVTDLIAAAEALTDALASPSLLIGHSLGGAAVLRAAEHLPSVRAVVTIGTPFEPGHVTENFAWALAKIEGEGWAEVDLGGRPVKIGRDFVEDVDSAELAEPLSRLKRALLVLHAPQDQVVGIDNATRIFAAAKHPKSFVTLDSADHLLSNPADAEYAANVIAAWASRYLDPPKQTASEAPDGVVRVREVAGYRQEVLAGTHQLTADEPLSLGGTDRGMTPYQLLSAGLGACTSITLRMYAERKQLPLDRVTVDVRHSKSSDPDSGERTEHLGRDVLLEGALTTEQRAALMRIANKCPVHRTLEAGIRIETSEK
ncbi:bifunctional alpha/beta hydrolase/OsmC family protein [Palleronia caenipelagi]|nr:bifunctional alpha/beta hydrolase/OsmC family protein [Palleronia caenipelagi]